MFKSEERYSVRCALQRLFQVVKNAKHFAQSIKGTLYTKRKV